MSTSDTTSGDDALAAAEREERRVFMAHLDHLLEVSETAREGWLAAHADEAPQLVARLRKLLGQRDRPDFAAFLGEDTAGLGLSAPGTLIGRRIGAYIIEAELGRGGMGSVWRARRADGQYEGRVAIKFLHLTWRGREGHERFRREAQFLAELNHPHIARLLDASVTDATQPYLVLEYVEGEPIDAYCDRLALDVTARVRLFLDVLSAVAHAHRHLIVHRDLKPANILVTGDGTVKLLDFGIGRLIGDDASIQLTRVGGEAMTPEYAAPEQLKNEAITTATDVHGLGLVLYVLLTGRHPFAQAGDTPADVLRQVLETDAARPSTLGGGRLRRALRGDLDNVLGKALEKAPDARYANASVFADDLERYLRQEPVAARAGTFAYRAGKFMARNRGAVAAAALTTLGLVIFAAAAVLQAIEARRQRDEARAQTQRAEGFSTVVTSLLSQTGADGRALSAEELLDRAVLHVEAKYADDPAFLVDMLIRLSGRYFDMQNTAKEYATLVKAENVARQAADAELILDVQCNTVETEVMAGRMDEARRRLEEARVLLARVASPPAALQADCLRSEAQFARGHDDLASAVRYLEDARAVLEADDRTEGNAYPGVLSTLGAYHIALGNPVRAHEYSKEIVELDRRLGRQDSAPGMLSRVEYAFGFYRFGEIRQALSLFRELIPDDSVRNPDKIESLVAVARYGEILGRLREYQAALPLLSEAVRRADEGSYEIMRINTRISLAEMLLGAGQLAEAEREVGEAGALLRPDAAQHRRWFAETSRQRAEILLAQRRGESAAAASDEALKWLRYPPGTEAPRVARALLTRARVHLFLNEAAQAAELARKSGELFARNTLDAEQSAYVGEALLMEARAEMQLGNVARARTVLARASTSLRNGLGAEHELSQLALQLQADLR